MPYLGQVVPAFLDHNINGGTVFLLTEVCRLGVG